MKKIKKIIKKLIISLYKVATNIIPTSKNIILFESNLGRNYSGNPRYIYEKMLEEKLDSKYKFVWIFENTEQNIPGNAIKVKRTRLLYFYYLCIAKMWVFDCRQPYFLIKKKDVVYIQTWHGTPLKKLALDMNVLDMAGNTNVNEYHEQFKRAASIWDYLISPNEYSSEIFKRAFDFKGTILETGYPRNDGLINNDNKEYIKTLKKSLGLPQDKKIILYAPTWRDNEYYKPGKYKFNLALDLELMKKELKDYVVILKSHYLVEHNDDMEKEYEGFIYKYGNEIDIQKLYLVSDLLITDYSSVMFDFSVLKRPMMFYTYDYERYEKELRGFYFDMKEEVPGPIVTNTNQLIKHIKEENLIIEGKYEEFIQKYNSLEDGNSSSRIVNKIKELMQ
ncbi:CDP-glycerol glycerophosphotransferase family protein [Romboutsia ilealis]|uniref:CDP-glycerol glycerophosphotransferase family protein n=1 Tax=Romboutsia ilealis TaxID=1115758 RepID=UPI002573DBEF|nr:CDP-glycerol glycerophosphotransferase family protein [Romboutsia ilealis]